MKKIIGLSLALLLLPCFIMAGGNQEMEKSGDETVTLVVWDQFYRGAENSIMEQIIEEFEAQHPGVVIQREAKTLDDLKLVLQMNVQSGTGPDIMQLNQGEADMGSFVKSDLLANLTDVAVAKGWEDRLTKANLTSMGYGGEYYGVSVTGEVVGFFYNKELFKELNLSIPATFEELEALLAKVKSAGYVPINFGNLDGWTGIHEWSSIQHVMTTRSELDQMMSGKSGSFWTVDANKKSAAKLQEWVNKGYFTKDFSAIGYDDSANVFYQGKSALMLTGNWLQGEIDNNAPFEAGFFLLPAPSSIPGNLKAVGGPGIPFVINKDTDNLDLAVEFLDLLTQEKTAVLWAENAMLPALPISEKAVPGATDLFRDILNSYEKVNSNNGIGYFIDWITPSFYDTSSSAVQTLMSGDSTPEEFVKALQEDYNSYH